MKLGILRSPYDENATYEQRLSMLGENTGNMVFGYSLDRILQTEPVPYNFINKPELFEKYDAIVLTDLIWIRENSDFGYLNNYLDIVQKPFVPISVGLQAASTSSEFKLNENTLFVLKRLEERAVLGIRGEYTASVLEKHGLKNYEVIGCPSMYYWNNPDLQIVDTVEHPRKLLSNFRTIYGLLTQKEKHFLSYSANWNARFVEQTRHNLELENVRDERYFSYVSSWLEKNKVMYFSVEEWMKKTQGFEFSMGGRFHGNVISLWNNMKSLFLYVDSRTKELTDHFYLPSLNMKDFDNSKPIEYYYEKADYSMFNKHYSKKFEEFKNFLKRNNIEISSDISKKEFKKFDIDGVLELNDSVNTKEIQSDNSMSYNFNAHEKKAPENQNLDNLIHSINSYSIKFEKDMPGLLNIKNMIVGYSSTVNEKQLMETPVRFVSGNIAARYIGAFSFFGSNLDAKFIEKIGRFCIVGNNVTIGSHYHPTSLLSTHPMFCWPETQFSDYHDWKNNDKAVISNQVHCINECEKFSKGVEIGNDVWIGNNVIILNGVKIGDGAIIGAGAVVVKDVEPYTIVAGVPAKTIRKRFSDVVIDELLNLQWWKYGMNILKGIELHDPDIFIPKLKDRICNFIDEFQPEIYAIDANSKHIYKTQKK